jgi:hypothetical protein
MSRWNWILVYSLVLLLTGCVAPTPPGPSPAIVSPLSSVVPATPDGERETKAVSWNMSEATTSRVKVEIEVGQLAVMKVVFWPVFFEAGPTSTSYRPWKPYAVAEMQICTWLDEPCELEGNWLPFTLENRVSVPVDWLGPREFWASVQFRDASGNVIPSVGPRDREPQLTSRASYTISGIVKDTTPVESLPPRVQTGVAATRTAFPLRGSVEIEGGRCCTWGYAGGTIEVTAAFEASSPHGEVTEMRVRTGGGCRSEAEMASFDWEPFEPKREYLVRVALNWIGFYVTAQYRDQYGNLSPAYCDDIGVEGHPPITP